MWMSARKLVIADLGPNASTKMVPLDVFVLMDTEGIHTGYVLLSSCDALEILTALLMKNVFNQENVSVHLHFSATFMTIINAKVK